MSAGAEQTVEQALADLREVGCQPNTLALVLSQRCAALQHEVAVLQGALLEERADRERERNLWDEERRVLASSAPVDVARDAAPGEA